MPDDIWIYPILCLAAFAAGVINALAGGGTLLTFRPWYGPSAVRFTTKRSLSPT